ncbi:group I intron-associated PD-(D/E)XK endonuclease [Bacillus velezensis]|uniref:group I intron-associated PD-(D/E)XK endonuclease n=1 Tax=Bacillus velezensis TaxID=492670 RepID=UPI002DBEF4F3|nr:group I intron-associated PD-(D/E)XK endonuclease [Bacillus velezensis]MEC3678215.1 group I intron-associated PD-(D/E)XK endonuclease [Bacillus velezensis]
MLPQMRINGAAAELFVKGDLLMKNYVPFEPEIDNTECDIAVIQNGNLVRIQVKSARSEDLKKVKFDLTRSSASSRFYTKDDFDVLALYDFATNKIAYIDWRSITHKRSITLRYTDTPCKNGFVGENGRLFFDDYRELPQIIRSVSTEVSA